MQGSASLIYNRPCQQRRPHGLHHPPIPNEKRQTLRSALPQTGRVVHRKAWLQAQDGRRCVGSGQCDHSEKRRSLHRPTGRKKTRGGLLGAVAGRQEDQGEAKLHQVAGRRLASACGAAVGHEGDAVNHARRSAAVGHRSGRTTQCVGDDSRRESASQPHGEGKGRSVHPRQSMRRHRAAAQAGAEACLSVGR